MDPVERETVFGRSIKMRGELFGAENITIEGDFEGTIRLGGARLTIGPEARVRANIAAQEIVVYGKVEGDMHATGTVALRAKAMVMGDIFAARFSMEEDTALRGMVDPTRADESLPPATFDWNMTDHSQTASGSESPAEQDQLAPVLTFSPSAPVAHPDLFSAVHEHELSPLDAEERYAHMPAGLAAAARYFDDVIHSSHESTSDKSSSDPSELAETKA